MGTLFLSPLRSAVAGLLWAALGVCGAAQTAAPGPAAPSQTLQPALDTVAQTVGALKLDKWKRGTVRDESAANVDSLVRDLKGTAPALLKDADAAPQSLAKALPLERHVDALYDVLLRVYEAARVAGPADQVGQIEQTLSTLAEARRAFAAAMEDRAAAAEKQMSDLQATVAKQAALLPCPAPATPPPCPKPAHKAAKKKPAVPSETAPAQKPQ